MAKAAAATARKSADLFVFIPHPESKKDANVKR
jgi:hypothetical protein